MSEVTTQPDHGLVNWDDQEFVPAVSQGDYDPIRWFRMSGGWPNNPLQDRKFQLGGKERVAILEQQVYHCWAHRFSKQYMNSAINGSRRCTLDSIGHCIACDHYEAAATTTDANGRKQKQARCSRRQQQFGCNLLVYKTDLEGRLQDEQGNYIVLDESAGPVLQNGTEADLVYEVFLWRFSADKFQTIREIKQEWGDLRALDISFVLAPGKDEKFQDFSPTVLRQSAWQEVLKKQSKDKAEAIIAYYKENRYKVEDIFGHEYSDEDMQRFLGIGSTPSQAAQVPVEELAAQIEAGIAAATSQAEPVQQQPPPPPPEPAAQPAQQQAPPASESPVSPTDFDSILAGT